MSDLFRFESDFVESLRCIPMAVRYRLDAAGVKLKLNEWSKLGKPERRILVDLPCGTPEEIRTFREMLSSLVAVACGAPPGLLSEAPEPLWESETTPAQVQEKARECGLLLPDDAWASLSALQRFALLKLSRPGHENRNFLPALDEFGVLPA